MTDQKPEATSQEPDAREKARACHPERSEGSPYRKLRPISRFFASLRMSVARSLLAPGFWLLASFLSLPVYANPTPEEVLKSLNQNLNEPADPSKFVALLFGAAGIVILLVLFSHRRKRDLSPRSLNHQGKLLKEVMKRINLKPSEVRQLKTLAEEQSVSSPLTLLLCPSVLAKAVKHQSGKVDARVIAQVARKMTSRTS